MTVFINSDLTVVILAGPGHRMYPLVSPQSPNPLSGEGDSLHKCLLPLGNKPMILHLLYNIQAAGCGSVIIVTAPRTVSKLSAVVRSAHFPLDISIIPDVDSIEDSEPESESSPLHALLRCKDLIRNDFCVLPADLFVSSTPLFVQLFNQLADTFRLNNSLMATLLLPVKGDSGDDHDRVLAALSVETDPGGLDDGFRLIRLNGIADMEEEAVKVPLTLLRKYPRLKFVSNCVDICWYIFSQEVMDLLTKLSSTSEVNDDSEIWSVREDLVPHVLKMSMQSPNRPALIKIADLKDNSLIMRVATVPCLGEANKHLAVNSPMAGKTDVIISDTCKLGEKTLVKRTVLGNHVNIGSSSKLVNCLVMDGVNIGPNCKLDNCIIGPKVTVQENAILKDCWIAPGVVIAPDTNLKGETVLAGTCTSKHFDDLFH